MVTNSEAFSATVGAKYRLPGDFLEACGAARELRDELIRDVLDKSPRI